MFRKTLAREGLNGESTISSQRRGNCEKHLKEAPLKENLKISPKWPLCLLIFIIICLRLRPCAKIKKRMSSIKSTMLKNLKVTKKNYCNIWNVGSGKMLLGSGGLSNMMKRQAG